MAKVVILQNYKQPERNQLALDWVLEDPEARVKTNDLTQVAVSLRQGFDVILYTNVFDGFEVEIKDQQKEETNDQS